jgi:hypothetical protein
VNTIQQRINSMTAYRSLLGLLLLIIALAATPLRAEDTLPALKDGTPPRSHEELWAGYDPCREPLDIEVLKQWEEDEVVLRVIRYRIGIFKGQKAMMAGVYGFPKGGTKLPGLLQIHGGGQYADYKSPLTNAKRGFATLSIAWAGRISAPGYAVNPDGVKLFWEGKTDDPAYKLTTDWGPLDGYHAPCRNPGNAFASVSPAAWTLDAVESPRNNPWFLCTLGARRGLTFLQQQPEVDGDRLGVYGHSMGGKLTVMTTAADRRVKASAPSCGGVSDRDSTSTLYRDTINDDQSLKRIACPIIFLSPANDFHGHIDDLQTSLTEIGSKEWRVTCSAHHNHQDTEQYQVAGLLWFDQYLKGTFQYPQTPGTSLELKTESGVPRFSVAPDPSRPILSVDVFYTQQGQAPDEKHDMGNTIARFWHHAEAQSDGKTWTVDVPLLSVDKPLWIYANVLYPLDAPVVGAGYYYGVYTAKTVNISSKMAIVTPQQLAAAGVKATLKPSLAIEAFDRGWQKEWFTYDLSGNWARNTHKLYDPQYKAPANAKLSIEVRAEQANKLVIGLDGYAAEVALQGGDAWQTVVLSPDDFRNSDEAKLPGWEGIKELRLTPSESLRPKQSGPMPVKARLLGGEWQGAPPEFRNLKWTAT